MKESLLKQGLAFYSLQDKAYASIALRELIKIFPNSSETKIARKKLWEQ